MLPDLVANAIIWSSVILVGISRKWKLTRHYQFLVLAYFTFIFIAVPLIIGKQYFFYPFKEGLNASL